MGTATITVLEQCLYGLCECLLGAWLNPCNDRKRLTIQGKLDTSDSYLRS